MLRRIAQVVFVTFGCLFVLLLIYVAVAMQFSTSSAGGTLPSGRTVTTQSDSWYISSGFSNDTATIETAGHSIVVAPTQLTVDGAIYATIAQNVKAVSVTVNDGEISFTADGKPAPPHRR